MTQKIKENLGLFCVNVQEDIKEVSDLFMEQMKRKVYSTPKSNQISQIIKSYLSFSYQNIKNYLRYFLVFSLSKIWKTI